MRRTTPLVALAACLTLAVTACDVTDTMSVLPGLKGVRLTTQQQMVANQLVTDLAANLQASTDLDLAALFTEPAGATAYRTQRMGGNREAEKQRETKLKERVRQQFDKHKGNMKATSVSTESVTVDGVACVATTTKLQFTRGAVTQSQTVTRTVDPEGTLIKLVGDMTRSFQNGMTFKAHRERTNAADGAYTATFHSEATIKGKTRIVDWTRTGTADGLETGTGTIQRFDGTKETLTITRTADGVTVTKTRDDATKVGVEVSQPDGSSDLSAKVTDATGGTETVVTTVPVNSEQTEPSAE